MTRYRLQAIEFGRYLISCDCPILAAVRWTMSCKEVAHEQAAQPGCSSQALRWTRGAGGGRRTDANGETRRGAGPSSRRRHRIHRYRNPAAPLRTNDVPPAAVRDGL